MSFPPELSVPFAIHEAFSREEERNIALLIEENLARGERVLMRHPAAIYSHFRDEVYA
jgi:hypothetical protein